MILKDKLAGERYLSIWMFLNWIIIVIAIVLGVLIFYSVKSDARPLEADLLSGKISDCLINDFKYEVVSASNFDIYAKCDLNRAVFDSLTYYFEVNITSDNGKGYSIFGGNKDYKVQCAYQKLRAKPEANFAQCAQKERAVRDASTGKFYNLEVTAASNQKEAVS